MKKSSSSPQDFKSKITELEMMLNEYFAVKAPALPAGVKEFIVWITPYGAILGILVAIPAILALLGITAVFAPMMVIAGGWGIRGIVSLIAMIVTIILYVQAAPALFKKQKAGWDKLFLVSLVSAVSALVSMNLFNLVVGTAISWYFLFQVRSYYK